MREGFRYCEKCGKPTPQTPGRSRACYACGSLYLPHIEAGTPIKAKREVKGKRPVKASGALKTKRPARKK